MGSFYYSKEVYVRIMLRNIRNIRMIKTERGLCHNIKNIRMIKTEKLILLSLFRYREYGDV